MSPECIPSRNVTNCNIIHQHTVLFCFNSHKQTSSKGCFHKGLMAHGWIFPGRKPYWARWVSLVGRRLAVGPRVLKCFSNLLWLWGAWTQWCASQTGQQSYHSNLELEVHLGAAPRVTTQLAAERSVQWALFTLGVPTARSPVWLVYNLFPFTPRSKFMTLMACLVFVYEFVNIFKFLSLQW